jgi:hypothetical protein
MSMIRGTTAQWKFVLPYEYTEIQEIMIMFWQPNNPELTSPIIKRKSDCTYNESAPNELYVSLRPSETALFSDRYKAKMQASVTPNVGLPFGIKERLITVYSMPDNIIPDGPDHDPTIETEDGWARLDGGKIIDD